MSVTFARTDLITRPRWVSISLFGAVRIVLGFVLLLAAGLKAYELASGPVAEISLLTSRWVGFAAVEIELLLGLWLLAGFWPRRLRWSALVWFAVLLGVSLSHAASGARSCACFGFVQVAPWLVAAFDSVALANLWFARPGDRAGISKIPSRRFVLAGFCLLYVLIAVPVGVAMWRGLFACPKLEPSVAALNFGTICQGSAVQRKIWLRNLHHGDKVTIEKVESSCPCASINLGISGIDPGEKAEAVVCISLAHEPHFVGRLNVKLTGRTKTGCSAFLIPLTVHVQPLATE